MAISQTGSLFINSQQSLYNAASGTISSITVPSDAEIMLIGVSGYSSTSNLIATNGNFNIGAATSVAASGGSGTGATSTGFFQSSLSYILAPATGTQDLEWQWGGGGGTALSNPDVVLGYLFLKGIDTGSPIRSQDGSNAGGDSESTGTLTAQTGDWIIAWGATFDAAEADLTIAWSGGGSATSLAQIDNTGPVDGSFGKAEPTGNQVITWTATGAEEGGISAFVIKAASGPRFILGTH